MRVRYLPTSAPPPSSPARDALRGFPARAERSYIEEQQQRAGQIGEEQAALDRMHTLIGASALLSMCAGAAVAWGVGYACLIAGGALLAGVIYARTRGPGEEPGG